MLKCKKLNLVDVVVNNPDAFMALQDKISLLFRRKFEPLLAEFRVAVLYEIKSEIGSIEEELKSTGIDFTKLEPNADIELKPYHEGMELICEKVK